MDLDERGLKAMRAKAQEIDWVMYDESPAEKAKTNGQLALLAQAYLDATQPEGESDRLAVVVNEDDQAFGWSPIAIGNWECLEDAADKAGIAPPYARQIVEVHLKRPEAPAVVKGRVV